MLIDVCNNQEVIELLSSFREIMHLNWEKMDVDKIQERWYVPVVFSV